MVEMWALAEHMLCIQREFVLSATGPKSRLFVVPVSAANQRACWILSLALALTSDTYYSELGGVKGPAPTANLGDASAIVNGFWHSMASVGGVDHPVGSCNYVDEAMAQAMQINMRSMVSRNHSGYDIQPKNKAKRRLSDYHCYCCMTDEYKDFYSCLWPSAPIAVGAPLVPDFDFTEDVEPDVFAPEPHAPLLPVVKPEPLDENDYASSMALGFMLEPASPMAFDLPQLDEEGPLQHDVLHLDENIQSLRLEGRVAFPRHLERAAEVHRNRRDAQFADGAFMVFGGGGEGVEHHIDPPRLRLALRRRQGAADCLGERQAEQIGRHVLLDIGHAQATRAHDLALGRFELPGETAQQGRLAAAVSGDQADPVARADDGVEVGKQRMRCEHTDAAQADGAHGEYSYLARPWGRRHRYIDHAQQ